MRVRTISLTCGEKKANMWNAASSWHAVVLIHIEIYKITGSRISFNVDI